MHDKHHEALAFLNEHSLGTLAVLSPEGSPRAHTVYYAADDSFRVYFCTLQGTRKATDLKRDPRAAFVVSTESPARTLQMEGVVEDLTETAVLDDTVRALLDTLLKKGPEGSPLAHLDPGVLRFYRLTPSVARYGDYANGFGSANAFYEIAL